METAVMLSVRQSSARDVKPQHRGNCAGRALLRTAEERARSHGCHELAPIIATLKKGTVKVTDSKKAVENFEINGGVVEVLNNKVIVLAEA